MSEDLALLFPTAIPGAWRPDADDAGRALLIDGVAITPLPDPERPAFLEGLVEEAVGQGARIVNRAEESALLASLGATSVFLAPPSS